MSRVSNAAFQLLRATDQEGPPVDLDAIARHLSLTVVKTKMASDVSGMLIRDEQDGTNTVGLNSEHAKVRRRFTLAHEIGHFQLHRGRPLIVDSPVRVNLRDRVSGMATDREEMEANRFAADLLMPATFVLDAISEHDIADVDRVVAELAHLFSVSQQAMGYRLINLGIVSTPH